MAGIGNGKRKPDGNAEISLQTGRTTNRKTKPPARRITIITTTATTTIRTKTKKPIRVITDQHPKPGTEEHGFGGETWSGWKTYPGQAILSIRQKFVSFLWWSWKYRKELFQICQR